MYRRDPTLSDGEGNTGRRIDRVTYAFPKQGDYVLPAVTLEWYDADAGKAEIARAPEVTVRVAAAAAAQPAIAPAIPQEQTRKSWLDAIDWSFWLTRGFGAVAIVLAFVVATARYLPRIRRSAARRRQRRERSEPACFRRLVAACRPGGETGAYRTLEDWTRSAGLGSFDAWTRTFGNDELRAETGHLMSALFGPAAVPSRWDSRAFAAALEDARRAWRASSDRKSDSALPDLNPVWGAAGGPHKAT
jgi:hypothetical protein